MARRITPPWSMRWAGRWRIASSPPLRGDIAQCCRGLPAFGQLVRVGEGTGAYGAALSRFLRNKGVEVLGV